MDQALPKVIGFVLTASNGGGVELVAMAARGVQPPESVWRVPRAVPDSDDGFPRWASGWESIGGPGPGLGPRGTLAVAANADGRLEAVVLAPDGSAWHAWQGHAGQEWIGWHSLDVPAASVLAGGLALALNDGGQLELFATAADGTVWHRWQRPAGAGPWAPWATLGRPADGVELGHLVVDRNDDGRLELFATDAGGALWHRWQRPAGGWASWASLGKPGDRLALGRPVVARNQDGRLELFATAADGAVWHLWQRPARGWAAWTALGDVGDAFTEVAAGSHADGRLVLFALATTRGGDQELWQREQTAPNDGWTAWRSFGVPATVTGWPELGSVRGLVVAADARGRLTLCSQFPKVYRELGNVFLYLGQLAPSSGDWQMATRLYYPPPASP